MKSLQIQKAFKTAKSFFYQNQITKKHFQTIGIVGSGQMGTGIAYVFNRDSKKQVVIYDSSEVQIQKSQQFISKLVEKQIQKQQLSEEEKNQINSRFTFTTNIEKLQSSNLIVEAIVENFEHKAELFRTLDKITDKSTILASNTSSISITKLGGIVSRPDKVIGMHFMNPVPIMKLVEVIKGLTTSEDTYTKIINSVNEMNKTPCVSEDRPGFIVNRILMPMINEAVFTLQEGIATKEDIDASMKMGTNVPMGPLTLADFIGLDTCLSIMNVLYSEFKDSKYRPCTLLVNYVNAGYLGKKTGRGFYEYK